MVPGVLCRAQLFSKWVRGLRVVIVRDEGDTLLLITQPDHARLAEQILAAMRSEPILASPDRSVILLAAREHDNGWAEVDAEPVVEADTGRPQDFLKGSVLVKQDLWQRAITRAARMDVRAGALTAEHALTVHGYRHATPEWRPFFESISAMRDDLLQQAGLFAGTPRQTFDVQYRCVRLADAFSLQFCNDWKGPDATLDYEASMNGGVLVINPDPFDGATVPLRVLGRRIAARRYEDDGDLRAALAATTPMVLEGEARGGRTGN